jgi:hypothetical protein
MSFYTELGVREDATRDEIRAAYLRLAKENHPDLMPNERERVSAEERMSRLNHLMEVLGHEEKRQEYDTELRRQRAAADVAIQEALALQAWEARRGAWRWGTGRPARIWLAATALVLTGTGTIFFWLNDGVESHGGQNTYQAQQPLSAANPEIQAPDRPNSLDERYPDRPSPAYDPTAHTPSRTPTTLQPKAQVPRPAAVPKGDRPVEVVGARRDAEELLREARRALEEPARVVNAAPPPAPPVSAPGRSADVKTSAALAPSSPPPSRNAAPPPPPPPPEKTEQPKNWAGVWRYSPKLGAGIVSQFNPLSIEMRLQEAGPNVRGIYKARYEVDRNKYASEVEFSLSGQAEGSERVRGEWAGAAGARGEFELKKTAAGVVQMSWWTTTFGKKKALVSGVARLSEGGQ